MTTPHFVAGPVHLDGYELNFFVDLAGPEAPLALLSAAYTTVILRDKKDELLFEAYESQHTRKTEDDWYALAKEHYDLHLLAMQKDPTILRDIRLVVHAHYFRDKVPAELTPLMARSSAFELQEMRYAA